MDIIQFDKLDNGKAYAKKKAKAAAKHAASLESNLNATAKDMIDADRALKVANQNVKDIEAIMERRF